MKKLFLLGLFVVLTASACTLGKPKDDAAKALSVDEAKVKATEFINGYLVNKGQEVSIKEITEEKGLYKIVVNLANGEETVSYISKDGAFFYPSGMDIEDFKKKSEENKQAGGDDAAADAPEVDVANIKKADKPKVELFVMSHCPYGTQMEKGILPVVKTLGNAIDFDLKFCDYAMHGKKELDEQLTQYCIQKEDEGKLNDYLNCFLADESKSAECIKTTGINKAKIDSCVKSADAEFKVTEGFNDKASWKSGRYPAFDIHKADNAKYGVSGSPSLVINGEKVAAGRDSASLLTAICAGFNKAPESCNTKLSSESPAPGFGFEGTGDGSAASCE